MFALLVHKAKRLHDLGRSVLEGKSALIRKLASDGLDRKTALFYPAKPSPSAVIYKLCHWCGYRMSKNPDRPFDIAIYWEDTTVRQPDPNIVRLGQECEIVNLNCLDVSKSTISVAFARVFGYDIVLDPRTHRGRCVRKSNQNATHDGQVIDCPIPRIEPGYIYQKLINNEVEGDVVQDIRVPVFRHQIPFVYLKYRKRSDRFSNENEYAEMADVQAHFSTEELERIRLFCRAIGLDYGELDVLRDRDEHRIYIVDVNPTPWGPPNHMSKTDRRIALDKMATVFESMWGGLPEP